MPVVSPLCNPTLFHSVRLTSFIRYVSSFSRFISTLYRTSVSPSIIEFRCDPLRCRLPSIASNKQRFVAVERITEMLMQLRANVVRTTSNLRKKFENFSVRSVCKFPRRNCNLMHRTATWNIRPMSRKSDAASTSQDACLAEKSFARINCIPQGRMRSDRSKASIGFQAGRNPAVRYDWKGPARCRGRKGEKATKRKNASSFDDGCTRRFFFFFPFLNPTLVEQLAANKIDERSSDSPDPNCVLCYLYPNRTKLVARNSIK